MTSNRRELGSWGEQVALEHLEARGYKILEQNWRCRLGEIDIVAQEKEIIVFVEVKTRRGRGFGLPEEALTPKKAQRLLDLGQQYLMKKNIVDVEWRIDLVAVEVGQNRKILRCEHVPNVVWGW